MFKIIYNKFDYRDYARTHERLADNLYIFYIKKKLYKYLRYCPQY